MTVIVAKYVDQAIRVGADSQASAGYDAEHRDDGKLFRLLRRDGARSGWYHPEALIGFTTSYRFGQIAQYHVDMPVVSRASAAEPHKYMVKRYVPALRKALKEHGYTKVVNERETAGTMIVATLGKIFVIYDDLQVAVPVAYTAIGCGFAYALGAMHAGASVTQALNAADRFSSGVGGPMRVETITL